MKVKFLILIVSIIISFHSIGQEMTKPYDYPIKPGMEEWKEFKSAAERVNAVTVPQDYLAKMDGRSIVETCINNPLMFEILLGNNIQSSYERLIPNLNILQELINSDTSAYFLVDMYKDVNFLGKTPVYKRDLRPLYIEFILGQDEIIYDLDSKSLNKLKGISRKHLMLKIADRENFGSVSRSNSARILAKVLISEGKKDELLKITDSDSLHRFLTKGYNCDDELLKKIIKLSE